MATAVTALDTSHEHIELLADQLSSSSHKNDTSNHIILKWKESYRLLEEKMHAKAKLLSKVEHDYSTLQHAMEFQRKEASLEKATLTAKFELATKRLNEALSAKNNTMQLANQLEMAKAELVLVKNENLTLGQHLKEKDIAVNRLSNDLMASQHTAEMNKSEIVIVRQELKDFGERYAEKESEAVRLASEVLSAGERLKRAMDEKAEVERKLIDQQQVFDTEMQNMKHRVLALETSKTQSEQASLRLKAEMDALQDRKKSLGMQLDASNARVTELKRMYDDLHYDAERERKLAQKLEKAKRTIKMQRHYTRGKTLKLHAATEGLVTMEQFRKVKKDRRSVTSFLTDLERLGLRSNTGKKLVLNAGYKDAASHGVGGVFYNNVFEPFAPSAMDDSDDHSGGQESVDDSASSEKENSENLNVAAGAQPSLPVEGKGEEEEAMGAGIDQNGNAPPVVRTQEL